MDKDLVFHATNGNFDNTKLLLETGADINANDNAALRLSAKNGHYDIVKL